MPARKTRPVRRWWDDTAEPPRQQEVLTAYDPANALAFLIGVTWDHNRPDHGDWAALSMLWGVIKRGAPVEAEHVEVTYTRDTEPGERFAVGDRRFRQFYEAIEAAAEEIDRRAAITRALTGNPWAEHVVAPARWHLDGPDDPEDADPDEDRDETGRQERREEADDPDPRI